MDTSEETLQELAEVTDASIDDIKQLPREDIEALVRVYYLTRGNRPK